MWRCNIPARNPRLSAVVEPDLADWLRKTADRQGISVSLLVRDLLRRAQEEEEERFWAKIGERRLATFDRESAVEHDRAWE